MSQLTRDVCLCGESSADCPGHMQLLPSFYDDGAFRITDTRLQSSPGFKAERPSNRRPDYLIKK